MGNVCHCHQRHIDVTLTTVTLYPAKRGTAGDGEMLSLRPQGRFSKQQLCWQGHLPCCLAMPVPSDSGKIWAVTPQTSSNGGGFLEAAVQGAGGAPLQDSWGWEEGSDRSHPHIAGPCPGSRQQPYRTSPRKLAALAGRKQR